MGQRERGCPPLATVLAVAARWNVQSSVHCCTRLFPRTTFPLVVVDVVVGRPGQYPHRDGVVGGSLSARMTVSDRHGEAFEHIPAMAVDVALDLDPVLLPQAIGHDLAARFRAALRPRPLHHEEGGLYLLQEVAAVKARVVGDDGGQALAAGIGLGDSRRATRENVPPHRLDSRTVGLIPVTVDRRRRCADIAGNAARHVAAEEPVH